MRYVLTGKPDYALAELFLDQGESVIAESGAMVAMTGNMKIETKARGGILSGLKRMIAGESFFTNSFHPEGGAGNIKFAPASPGDVDALELKGQTYFMQAGSYMAHVGDIEIDTKYGGLKSMFAGEGLFWLKISGTGTVFFNSYGGLKKVSIDGSYIVDTTHIVAFDANIQYTVQPVGGLKATFLSGEGLVCRYSGQGDLWIQTRSAPAFAGWLHPFRRVEQKKNE